MAKTLVELSGIRKSYGASKAVNGVDLTVSENEFVTLLGPSGCGKTTLLRLIGGFETPDEGEILFEGERLNGIPPWRRKLNTVFQSYALFPHMNVAENVAFGLRSRGIPPGETRKRVSEFLELVGLSGFERRKPSTLSGGQQQRVAIARALVNEPRLLLLDEPLGALDSKLRREMQLELKKIQRQSGITFIFVTHDQEEALSMSDTVAVMRRGKILQIGSPEDVYNEPENEFVAGFIGLGNILPGTMERDRRVRFSGRVFDCVDGGFEHNERVRVIVRPEDVQLTSPEEGMLRGTVESVTFKGVHYEMTVLREGAEGSERWLVHSTVMAPQGSAVGMSVAEDMIHVMKESAE